MLGGVRPGRAGPGRAAAALTAAVSLSSAAERLLFLLSVPALGSDAVLFKVDSVN